MSNQHHEKNATKVPPIITAFRPAGVVSPTDGGMEPTNGREPVGVERPLDCHPGGKEDRPSASQRTPSLTTPIYIGRIQRIDPQDSRNLIVEVRCRCGRTHCHLWGREFHRGDVELRPAKCDPTNPRAIRGDFWLTVLPFDPDRLTLRGGK